MSALFYYKIIFLIELLIAEFLFAFKFKHRNYFLLRLFVSIAFCFLLAWFYPLPKEIAYSSWYTSIMFLVLFIGSFIAVKFTFKIDFIITFFITITAYTVQHLSYEIVNVITTSLDISSLFGVYSQEILDFTNINEFFWLYILINFSVYSTIYGFSYLVLSKRISSSEKVKINSLILLAVSALFLLVDIILNSFAIYINEGYNKSYTILLSIYNIICCTFVFYIQLSLIKENDIKKEVETVSDMLRLSQKQYAMQKENINLINQKCHDIKYQLHKKIQNNDIDAKEIDHIVSIYDSTFHTGNDVLDIVFTEKSLYCNEKNIQFTCMVDNTNLSFISEGDLYTLFGNILDNAIEATSKLQDSKKRCVSVNMHTVENFITITINNYYEGKIIFEDDGLPRTSKGDTNYHGYGIRSIKTIVEKYNGNLSLITDSNIFRLNILFQTKQ